MSHRSKYLRVYELLCPDDQLLPGDSRAPDIAAEMKAIAKAATNRDAAAIIDWWDCWDSDRECLNWVKKARAMLGVKQCP